MIQNLHCLVPAVVDRIWIWRIGDDFDRNSSVRSKNILEAHSRALM